MKKLFVLSVSLVCVACVHARELVDKVVARVNGQNITHCQLATPQIIKNGAPFTLDECITQELWVQRAVERQVAPSQEDIQRSINMYRKENDLVGKSDEEADKFLVGQIGINFATYSDQLKRHYAVESLKSIELRNRCSVSESEVRTYHEQHPDVQPAQYRIEVAILDEQQAKDWVNLKDTAGVALKWDSFDWLSHEAIAPHLREVYTMEKGSVSKPIDHDGEHLVVRLADKKRQSSKTLSERYARIEHKLQQKKIDRYARDMEKELRKEAVIVEL